MKYIGLVVLICTTVIVCIGWFTTWENPLPSGLIIFVPNTLFRGSYMFFMASCKVDTHNNINSRKKCNKTWLTNFKCIPRKKIIGICLILWSLIVTALYIFGMSTLFRTNA